MYMWNLLLSCSICSGDKPENQNIPTCNFFFFHSILNDEQIWDNLIWKASFWTANLIG